jgi:hypothetical protein
MERDVEQTAKASREHLGQRSDRRRVEHTVLDLTQSSWALCDEHAAIREERDAPRVIESLGDDRDVDACLGRRQDPTARRRAYQQERDRVRVPALSSRGALSAGRWRTATRWRSSLACGRRLLRDPGIVRSEQDEDPSATHHDAASARVQPTELRVQTCSPPDVCSGAAGGP